MDSIEVAVVGAAGLAHALEHSGRFAKVHRFQTTSQLRDGIAGLGSVKPEKLTFLFADSTPNDIAGLGVGDLVGKLSQKGYRVAVLECSAAGRQIVIEHPGAGLIPSPISTNIVLGALSDRGMGMIEPVGDAWAYQTMDPTDPGAFVKLQAKNTENSTPIAAVSNATGLPPAPWADTPVPVPSGFASSPPTWGAPSPTTAPLSTLPQRPAPAAVQSGGPWAQTPEPAAPQWPAAAASEQAAPWAQTPEPAAPQWPVAAQPQEQPAPWAQTPEPAAPQWPVAAQPQEQPAPWAVAAQPQEQPAPWAVAAQPQEQPAPWAQTPEPAAPQWPAAAQPQEQPAPWAVAAQPEAPAAGFATTSTTDMSMVPTPGGAIGWEPVPVTPATQGWPSSAAAPPVANAAGDAQPSPTWGNAPPTQPSWTAQNQVPPQTQPSWGQNGSGWQGSQPSANGWDSAPTTAPNQNGYTAPLTSRKGFVISVCVSKGGAGKSSLTLNMGVWLATKLRALGRSVCIVDANWQQADIGKQINAYNPNIAGLSQHQEDLVAQRIGRHLYTREDLNTSFLLGPARVEEANPLWINPQLYSRAVEQLRYLFDYILVDSPVAEYHHELFTDFILPRSDFILVPVLPNWPTIINTDNWLRNITTPKNQGGQGFDERRVGIVLNRAEADIGMDENQVQQELGSWHFLGSIPDSKEWRRAANSDEVIATRNVPELNRAFSQIMYAITQEELLLEDLNSGDGRKRGRKW